MEEIVKHHIQYREIHGIDEVSLMFRSNHLCLHQRLRSEGKCNIPAEVLRRISICAANRIPDILHENGLMQEYLKQIDARKAQKISLYKTACGFTHTFIVEGTEILYKKAGKGNATSSRVNLPKDWEGEEVAIVKLVKKHD